MPENLYPEIPDPEKPKMKMIFHFQRCDATDIPVEGATYGECAQKAINERMKQVTPTKIAGEVIDG